MFAIGMWGLEKIGHGARVGVVDDDIPTSLSISAIAQRDQPGVFNE